MRVFFDIILAMVFFIVKRPTGCLFFSRNSLFKKNFDVLFPCPSSIKSEMICSYILPGGINNLPKNRPLDLSHE